MSEQHKVVPAGYLHRLHTECGVQVRFSDSDASPFGKCGVDYDQSYTVSCAPLYEHPAALTVRGKPFDYSSLPAFEQATGYTVVDMTTAAAEGFGDGVASGTMDMQQPMNDAERAALNIKFEYERAKKLRAAEAQAKGINTPSNLLPGQAQMLNMTPAERGTQIHAYMLNAPHALNENPHDLRFYDEDEVKWDEPAPYIVRGEFHAGAKLRDLIDAQNAMLQDTANDIRAMQNVASSMSLSDTAIDRAFDQSEAKAARSPSILKLAINLTVRMLLVIGVAILVLALVTK